MKRRVRPWNPDLCFEEWAEDIKLVYPEIEEDSKKT